MLITVLATDEQRQVLTAGGIEQNHHVQWISDISDIFSRKSELYIDLLFVPDGVRINTLKKVLPATVIINSVVETLQAIHAPFIRINGWKGFLNMQVTEAAVLHESEADNVSRTFAALNWKYKLVPDTPGMIAARVVAMMINEAYFALEDEVSSKPEIDIAMKLGTNYPFGPFEWCDMIGISNVASLLTTLSDTDSRYQPSSLLLQEAKHGKHSSSV